ncbi:unnamed protein product [Musa acuminata subsp. burmannicoides]
MAATAFAASSTAAAVLGGARLPVPGSAVLIPPRPRRSSSLPLPLSSSHSHDVCRFSSLRVRASSSSEESSGSVQTDELLADLKDKESRKELATDIESMKKKIVGTGEQL